MFCYQQHCKQTPMSPSSACLHLVRKVVDSAMVEPGHKDPPDCQDVASVGPEPPQELGAKVTLG